VHDVGLLEHDDRISVGVRRTEVLGRHNFVAGIVAPRLGESRVRVHLFRQRAFLFRGGGLQPGHIGLRHDLPGHGLEHWVAAGVISVVMRIEHHIELASPRPGRPAKHAAAVSGNWVSMTIRAEGEASQPIVPPRPVKTPVWRRKDSNAVIDGVGAAAGLAPVEPLEGPGGCARTRERDHKRPQPARRSEGGRCGGSFR